MSTRSDGPRSEPGRRAEATSTFVFADLAGFTALTEAHGDDEATDIATNFADQVRSVLVDYDGEEVKTIGDEVMIRMGDPIQAVEFALRIVEKLARPGSPPVRVGMHSGSAVERDGDWFGATVNLASRVAGVARAGEVLLTADTRELIADPDGFEIEERGPRYLKHIPEPVAVYRAVGPGRAGHHLEIDPVCRMAVDPSRAAAGRRRLGLRYFFCSAECAGAFAEDPRRYIATSRAARIARKGFLLNLGAFLVVGAAHLVGLLLPDHGNPNPGMILLFVAWAGLLVFHFRAVRSVL